LLNPGGLPRTPSGKAQRSACQPAWRRGELDVFATFEAEALAAAGVAGARPERRGESGGAADGGLEAHIARIWAEELGRAKVGRRENFFDLGGNSLTAAAIVARVRQISGLEGAAIAALFAAHAAAPLATKTDADRSDLMIPFAPIPLDSDAIFALWSATTCRHLGRRLGEEGILLVSLRLLDEARKEVLALPSIEDIARFYVAVLRRAKPEGPYILLGFCPTAALAFEMGRQLGADASLTIIVDTLAPQFWRRGPLGKTLLLECSLRRRWWIARRLLSAPPAERWSLVAQMVPFYGSWRGRLRRGQGAPRNPLYDHLWQATNSCHPQPHAGPILVLRGETQARGPSVGPALGWSEFATGKIVVAEAPGDHESMFDPPNVGRMARIIVDYARACRRAIAARENIVSDG
jgi:thioesterase domain-containing protein